jgi:hypothetical protein
VALDEHILVTKEDLHWLQSTINVKERSVKLTYDESQGGHFDYFEPY